MKTDLRLQRALEQLADRFDGGHLLASVDPVAFVEMVIDEIDSLEAMVNKQQKEKKAHCAPEQNACQ